MHVSSVADSAQLEGERKTVTALFADIKGSMDLMEDLDPEEARAIVDPALKLMIDAAHRYGGYIVQSTGDGIFALFGAPIAYEDHPQRAVFARSPHAGRRQALRREAARAKGQPICKSGSASTPAKLWSVRSRPTTRTPNTRRSDIRPASHRGCRRSRRRARSRSARRVRKLVEGYFALKPLGGHAGSKASASRSTFTK